MSPSGSTSSAADEEDVAVPVSSLRSRWEQLSSGGPSAPLPSTLTSRGGSRVVSAPTKKDMPTTKVFPAAREGKESTEEEQRPGQSGVDLIKSVRPRGSSNPISPSLLPQPLPPSPQPSPPLHPSSMSSSSSRSSQESNLQTLRNSSSSSSLSAHGATPTQAHFPPTPNRSPPSPSRNGFASTPLPDVSNTPKPLTVVKKAPPPPPPSRSSKPPTGAPSKETSSEKAPVEQERVFLASRPVEEETAGSVASLRSMFGASTKSSGTSTPGATFTPPISRTTSMSSTRLSIPPPIPTSRPALVAQLSSLPTAPSLHGEPSIPRKPSTVNLSSRPPPPRPPSKAPSSSSSPSTSPTELAASSTATSYAFPEILGTSTLQSTPSLPPRPKPQVPARPVAIAASLPPPANATPNGTGDARPKPPLPVRKPTPSSGSSAGEGSVDGEGEGPSQTGNPGPPPPIPGNRPILDRPLVSAPPPLPVRSKTIVVPARLDPVPSQPYRPPPPPSFPPSHRLEPTRLDRSISVSSQRLGSRSSSRQTSPLPPTSRELPDDVDGEVYKPPPPPVRKSTVAAPVEVATPKRKSSDPASDDEGGAHGYGSDEEDEEVDPSLPDLAYIPSSQQFKKVDDLPDPTLSNRRPPILHPHPLKITGTSGNHHLSAFASSGGTLAIGSFHLRVYNVDDHEEQGPTLLWDQKEMGLEVKSKDPKITALCFRPVLDDGEAARYLWCGSKDGHLWEVDVWGSAVIQSRSNAHPTTVSSIFKYKNSMLTLDETGKACLYTMSEAGTFNINVSTQTLRVAERQTFTGSLGHQIWTSSGPLTSSSSIKTAASRGPTMRVYEPFGESAIGAAGRVLSVPDTVTGAVLSATIIPNRPDLVYVGHEGGQISIWSRDTYVCTSVIKISTSAILSLIGVGSKLWAGTRTGEIRVYDVETQPWTITNLWKAHDNTPVLGFEVDVTSIEHGHLRVYSWGRDNCVQGWDGLLSEDWQETRLADREAEFCTYRDLTVLACTWNIDASKPAQLTGTTDNAGFLTSVLTSEDSPDIIVFGFQELIDLNDKKLQAKTLLFGKSKGVNGEMSAKVSQRYQLWHDKLVQAVRVAMPPQAPYTVIHAQNLVGLFTCIFVKNTETINIRDIAVTTVKRGMAGTYGNKGAILARFVIDDSSLCFINCHLAAGQRQKSARNADLAGIFEEEARFPVAHSQLEELAYAGGGDGSMVLDHDLCFLQGDLNYRIDLRRENVISSLRAGERAYLLEHDQLLKEMRTNSSFRLRTFNEAPIAFDPTYKYNRNSDDYDSSEKKRVPAWCDRILFRSRVPDNIEPLHYKRYEPTVSDHRPVSAGFQVKIRKVQYTPRLAVLNEIQARWEVEKAPYLHAASTFYASL